MSILNFLQHSFRSGKLQSAHEGITHPNTSCNLHLSCISSIRKSFMYFRIPNILLQLDLQIHKHKFHKPSIHLSLMNIQDNYLGILSMIRHYHSQFYCIQSYKHSIRPLYYKLGNLLRKKGNFLKSLGSILRHNFSSQMQNFHNCSRVTNIQDMFPFEYRQKFLHKSPIHMFYRSLSLCIHNILEDRFDMYQLQGYEKIHQNIHYILTHLSMLHKIKCRVNKFYLQQDNILMYISHRFQSPYIFHRYQNRMNIWYYCWINKTLQYKMYKHWISNSYKIKQSKRDILSLKDIIVLHNSDIHFSHYILGNIMGRVSNFQMLSHDSNPKHSLGILKENSSILYILDCTANIYFDMQNILISIHYTYFDQYTTGIHHYMSSNCFLVKGKFLWHKPDMLQTKHILSSLIEHIGYKEIFIDKILPHIHDMQKHQYNLGSFGNRYSNLMSHQGNRQVHISNTEN